MKKYRFRKMWFQITDNKIVDGNLQMVNAFVHEEYARKVTKQQESHHWWDDETKPLPVKKVEGFYLVHESLYEKLLLAHDEDYTPPAA